MAVAQNWTRSPFSTLPPPETDPAGVPPPTGFQTISPAFQDSMDTSGLNQYGPTTGPGTGFGEAGGPGHPGLTASQTPTDIASIQTGLQSNAQAQTAVNVASPMASIAGAGAAFNPVSAVLGLFSLGNRIAQANLTKALEDAVLRQNIEEANPPDISQSLTPQDVDLATQAEQGEVGINAPQAADVNMGAVDSGIGMTGEGGASGDGAGATVVCTELHRQGLLSGALWRADQAAGLWVEANDPDLYYGYRTVGEPLARLMARSPLVTRLARPWALAFAKKAAGRRTVLGSIIWWAAPAIRLLGWLRRLYAHRLAKSLGGRVVNRVQTEDARP